MDASNATKQEELNTPEENKTWKDKLREILDEDDTSTGRVFNITLFIVIIFSIIPIMLEGVTGLQERYSSSLFVIEWVVTIFFTIEYIIRLIAAKKPVKYIFSFYGIIDLLSTIPTYLAYFATGHYALSAIRVMRVLRLFRILKFIWFTEHAEKLRHTLKNSISRMVVLICTILVLAMISGTLVYFVEGGENGFTDVPRSIYWAIVTITTVGFGDIAPQTPMGQFITGLYIIIGYSIIVVSIGFLALGLRTNDLFCPNCLNESHHDNAKYCHKCGKKLP